MTLADPKRFEMLRLRGLIEMASGRYQNAKNAFKHFEKDPFIEQLELTIDKYIKLYEGKTFGMRVCGKRLSRKRTSIHKIKTGLN